MCRLHMILLLEFPSKRVSRLINPGEGGGGYLGSFLLGMYRWPLRAPTPL